MSQARSVGSEAIVDLIYIVHACNIDSVKATSSIVILAIVMMMVAVMLMVPAVVLIVIAVRVVTMMVTMPQL